MKPHEIRDFDPVHRAADVPGDLGADVDLES
jgi:hypothetical protein